MDKSLMKTHRRTKTQQSRIVPKLTQIPTPSTLDITVLDLSHNSIVKMTSLHNLRQLTSLNLSSNRIAKIEGIFTLVKLEELYLGNNLIQRLSQDIKQLSNLNVLDVAHNKIFYIHCLDPIRGMKFRTLNLEGNKVTARPGFPKLLIQLLVTHQQQEEFVSEDTWIDKQSQRKSTIVNNSTEIFVAKQQTHSQSDTLIGQVTQEHGQYVPNPPSQLLNALEQKDRLMSEKKDQLMSRFRRTAEYSDRLRGLLARDRESMENQEGLEMGTLTGKYMLDVSNYIDRVISQLSMLLEQMFKNIIGADPVQHTRGQWLSLLNNEEVDYQQILKVYLRGNPLNGISMSHKSILQQYSMMYSKFRNDVVDLDEAAFQYVCHIQHVYQVLQLKHMFEGDQIEQTRSNHKETTQQVKSQYSAVIQDLQAQLAGNWEYQSQLIRENNSLLQQIDNLKTTNDQLTQQMSSLKERWVDLQEVRQQSNMQFDSLVQRQDCIINTMEQKLTSDFIQDILLNQAKTIQQLISRHHYLKDKVYVQEMQDKLNGGQAREVEKNLGTSKKRGNMTKTTIEYSSQSNLLSSDKPTRLVTEFNPYCQPTSYFNKYIAVQSRNVSQPSTHRYSEKKTSSNLETHRRRAKNHQSNSTTVCKFAFYDRKDVHQSQNYQVYLKYYLRNSLVNTLVDKQTHPKLKERFSTDQLRRMKLNSLMGSRVLTK